MILEIKPRTENPTNATEIMASITFLGGTEMRLQLDVAKKECPFKYKIAIMLLHIHKFLLRAYHSMQSTLPYRHGSRGSITTAVGGGNSHVSSEQDGKGSTGSVTTVTRNCINFVQINSSLGGQFAGI